MDRSRLPYVLGVLAISFAILGAVTTLLTYDAGLPAGVPIVAGSMVVGILHFYGGVLALQYKPAGLKILTAYAIVALTLAMASLAALFVLPVEQDGKGGVSHDEMASIYAIAVALASLPWPIVVLALAIGTRAREACQPQPACGFTS